MEKIVLFVDDAAYAREFLATYTVSAEAGTGTRHWVLVACAPRMTHRISKWVSHSARENWRAKWFAKVQEQLMPLLGHAGDQVTPLLAKGQLADMTQRLKLEHGLVRVVDARRPKIGVDLEPVAPGQKPSQASAWTLPGAVLSMGALLVLANELSE